MCSVAALVQRILASFSELESGAWDERAVESAIEHVAMQCGVGKGKVLAVLRTALTGNKVLHSMDQSQCMSLSSSASTGAARTLCGRSGSSPWSGENTAAAVDCAALSRLSFAIA